MDIQLLIAGMAGVFAVVYILKTIINQYGKSNTKKSCEKCDDPADFINFKEDK